MNLGNGLKQNKKSSGILLQSFTYFATVVNFIYSLPAQKRFIKFQKSLSVLFAAAHVLWFVFVAV